MFFLDYIAVNKIELDKCEMIIKGIIEGCRQAGCKVLGGETAEMPGIYPENGFDLAGFSVGCISNNELPKNITAGDKVYGLTSSGIHSNGYSLVRKLLEKHNYPNNDELLTPTRIYVNDVKKLAEKYKIKGLAHITGGGLTENVPRILPEGLVFDMDFCWELPSVFKWIQEKSGIDDEELFVHLIVVLEWQLFYLVMLILNTLRTVKILRTVKVFMI